MTWVQGIIRDWIAVGVCILIFSGVATQAAQTNVAKLNDVVRRAFEETHAGWSSDELLLQDTLNRRFIRRCLHELPMATTSELNWTLLNLRKAGKLRAKVSQRRRDNHQDYRHLAEIAARLLQVKHKVSTDRIMCNPGLRAEFNQTARQLANSVDPYLMRKAAFGLRKARQLRPELVLRVADWDRTITTHAARDVARDGGDKLLPELPGVYIFRDATGYLYVGESKNLRDRIVKHLDESDRKSLAHYFASRGMAGITIEIHAFPANSRAQKVGIRRAYESELIASRKPRLNVRP